MILYVTSFNREFFKSSGKNLMDSFKQSKSDGLMLVGAEGISEELPIFKERQFLYHNLDSDQVLQNWLVDNADVIPKFVGGNAAKCKCNNSGPLRASFNTEKHQFGCPYFFWNKRASNWARKTFTMVEALKLNPEYLVWIDSDSRFTSRLNSRDLKQIFGEHSAIYHYGPTRKKMKLSAAETGLMGFKAPCYNIIESVYNQYLSREYIKQPRWDDSWLYTKEFEKNVLSKDLITKPIVGSHVVGYGPFKNFIQHNKGRHFREGLTN